MPPTRGILVVSDDPALQLEARFAFPDDFDVVLVEDAREAWRELASWTPAVVVVDLLVGSAGGFALGRDMSQDRRLANVPIFMLIDRHQDEWLARQAGADAVRTKPVDTSELVANALDLLGEKTK